MRLTFDREADAAFVDLLPEIPPGGTAHTHICDVEVDQGAIILAFDADDRLIGVEILGATKLLPPALLRQAEDPG